jgi:hypothetical protein
VCLAVYYRFSLDYHKALSDFNPRSTFNKKGGRGARLLGTPVYTFATLSRYFRLNPV